MRIKKYTWLIFFFACLALVYSTFPESGSASSTSRDYSAPSLLATSLTSLYGEETDPDLAYDSQLDQYLLVFSYFMPGSNLYSIQAQFVSGSGTPNNIPLLISTQGSEYRLHPAVAYNHDLGEFLVIWSQQFAGDPNDYDIYARRMSINGYPNGDILTIDYTANPDSYPDIAYNPVTGEYLAVWERSSNNQSEICGQRLSSEGVPILTECFYIASDSLNESSAAVDYDDNTGEFLVVYHIESEFGNYDIFGQRVSSIGELAGGLIQISTAPNSQMQPQLAYNINSDQFLVVWQDERVYRAIYGQLVNGAGELVGINFAIADEGTNYRRDPKVAFQINSNEFMVTWSLIMQGEDVNVYRRRVPIDGVIIEPQSIVSGESTLEQSPTVAAGSGLSYLLAWQDSRDISQGENIYGTIDLASAGACGGVFLPSADSTAYQDDPTTPHGRDFLLQVSRTADPAAGTAFSYLSFDVGERIPDEAIIHSAELRLTLFQEPIPAEFPLELVRSPQEWAETSLTWNVQPAWQGSFNEKSYYPLWNEFEPVILYIDVSTLVNLWSTDVFTPTGLALIPGQIPMSLSFFSRELPIFAPRLIVHCSPTAPELPQSYSDVNALQLAAIERLMAQSSVPPIIQLGESGAVRFASFDISTPANLTDALSRATWFVQEYYDLMRLNDPVQNLQFVRQSPDQSDLFFRQRYNGIPVVGSEIGIHLLGTHVTGLSGSYLSDLQLNTAPQITADRAREIALAIVNPRAHVVSEDQLRLLNRSLFGPNETRTFLTWLVVLDVNWSTEYYIDANTGALRLTQPRTLESFDLDIETANHHAPTNVYCGHWLWTADDDHWCDENGCSGDADQEGLNAYNNIKTIYDYWKTYLNRDSYDNDGSEIQMYIHVGVNWDQAHWVPACDFLEFGDGNASIDTIAHEFTHGVTQHTSNLFYLNESGALHESFADIFAAFVDDDNWILGEDEPSGFYRSLANPPDKGQPDRYGEYFHTTSDYGGTHTNSGITNKAAYLITTGDDFNGVDLPWGGLSYWRARDLFYKTLTRLPTNASMLDLRNIALATASEFVQQGKYGWGANQVCIVRNAYHAVELGEGDLDCDGTEDNIDPDVDGDKVSNSQDNCSTVENPDQQDTDKDGQGDACDTDDDNDHVPDIDDNCPLVFNQGLLDTDEDGFGDACDDNDDNDQIPDIYDNCPSVINPDQLNTDNDKMGDACDDDDDNDTVKDFWDNCPLVPNLSQSNSDNIPYGSDKYGDACDLCPDLAGGDNGDPDNDGKGNACDEDDDNDGILDGVDNCPQAHNPDQRDLDGDGKGWACDSDDADDMLNKLKSLTLDYYRGSPIRFPLPGCGMCGPGYIDPAYYQEINLVSSGGFYASIVDSGGRVVARGSQLAPDLLSQSLTFRPEPFASHLGFTGIESSEGVSLAADDVRYYLELFPAEGLDLDQDYSLSIQVLESRSNNVYLPIVKISR